MKPSLLKKPGLFILAGIVITLITTGVVAVALYQMRKDAMAQARDTAENLAISLQKEIQRTLDIDQLAIRNVMTSMTTPSLLDMPAETRQLIAFSSAGIATQQGVILATDASGKVVLDSRSTHPADINLSQRDYFKVQARDAQAGLYISKPYIPLSGNQTPSIGMSQRIEDAQGRFAGVVVGSLHLAYFHHLFEDAILGNHGTLTLLLTDGTVLMRQPYKLEDIGRSLANSHSFPPLVRSNHGTYVDVAALDQVQRLYSFRRIGSYPLVVVAGLGTLDIYKGWHQRAVAIGAVTAGLDMLIIALCLMFSAQLRRRLATERQLEKLAWFDSLTSLPNRAQISRTASRILAEAQETASHVAILFIDLDRFKRINDTQGHAIGDEVLIEAALRLRHCMQGADDIGRLGGDEFLAVLRHSDVHNATLVAARMLKAIQQPMQAGSKHDARVTLSASIGVALYPHDGQDVDTLLRNADMAMYQAKSAGRNQMHFYASEYERQAKEHLELEMALQRALQAKALRVAYQPKVGADGTLRGAEALVRWHDDKLGFVPPDRFIAIAEESGLITELDMWVLDEACRQLAAWRASGIDIPSVSVNVCSADCKRADYPELLARTLGSHGLTAGDLVLEMTERVMFDESTEDIHTSLEAINALGIALSIDDFGTGYSSLSYLHRFPVRELKLDKSFVQGIGTSAMAESLAQTVMNIGNVLHVTVIAEGVETRTQRDFLLRHGCRVYQGYLYSPPLQPDEFARWVRALDKTG